MSTKTTSPSWQPGMGIESEAHYHEVTENLARELIGECSTEELAVIAAQHMIYVDALTMTSESQNALIEAQDQTIGRLEETKEYILKNTARITKIVLESWKKKASFAKTSGLRKWAQAKQVARARAQLIAGELWKRDIDQKIRLGEMAQIVWARLIDEGYKDTLPNSTNVLNDWIRPVAPSYARKPGPPKKRDGQNH